jgi:dTDP-4-amino-4,6-dideoxygalactose transaminase
MCISATAPLFYGAVPVFADVEREYFCLDPKSVEERITPRTKAILVVDIFGASHDAEAINAVAKKHGLAVIADSAQCPGAMYKGKFAGTLSDIGIYSLNVHKNINTGEGAIAVTDDKHLAERLQLIRNHAEAVVKGMGISDISNLVGYNSRMTELTAAIGTEQLKKMDALNVSRRTNVAYIAERSKDMPGFVPAPVRPETEPVFHHMPFLYDEAEVGVARELFIEAIAAELPATKLRETDGPLIYGGYSNLHLLPVFQKKIAFGPKGYPFVSPLYEGVANYDKGICPVAERLYEKEFVGTEMMRPGMEKEDLDDVIEAFHKVYENREELR